MIISHYGIIFVISLWYVGCGHVGIIVLLFGLWCLSNWWYTELIGSLTCNKLRHNIIMIPILILVDVMVNSYQITSVMLIITYLIRIMNNNTHVNELNGQWTYLLISDFYYLYLLFYYIAWSHNIFQCQQHVQRTAANIAPKNDVNFNNQVSGQLLMTSIYKCGWVSIFIYYFIYLLL